MVFAATPALADTISVSSSDDGFGSSYTLTADCSGSVCSTVTLKIDATGATKPYISNVAFKIGSSDSLEGTLTAPTSDWSTITSSLSSGGCVGGNSDGQICSSADGAFASTGGILTWTWTNVDVTGDLTIGHVGYKYDKSTVLGKGLIVSVDYPNVPEPGTLALLAAALVGLVASRRSFRSLSS